MVWTAVSQARVVFSHSVTCATCTFFLSTAHSGMSYRAKLRIKANPAAILLVPNLRRALLSIVNLFEDFINVKRRQLCIQ